MKRGQKQQTLYVIAYDIPNDKRRTKIHKTLCGVGAWTQYSLFECHLTEKELLTLRDKLNGLLKPDEDSLRFYPLCAGCLAKVETVGSLKPAAPALFIV